MQYGKYSLLNPRSIRLEQSFETLESLRRINGGYIAAPNPGKPDGTGKYNVFWLRDIMFATYANEYLGNMDKMIDSYELVMTIMMKYHSKIQSAIRNMPKDCQLHARYHPNTLEELTTHWGHHQLDVLGLFLYKIGDITKKGFTILKEEEQRDLIRDVIQYLFTYRWETHPDFGVWEEGPELHSSSMGAVLAGLTMWFDDGHYHYKYKQHTDLSKIAPVSERLFDTGRDALMKLLPRESESRECDFAQLSLIWPYNIVDADMKRTIIERVETKLLREQGVVRYPGDHYFNADPNNKLGNEAQWPLGLVWLAVVHNKMASWETHSGRMDVALGHLRKSKDYLLRLDNLLVEGAIPELYTSGKPNDNIPLAWAHSFHIVALQSFLNALEQIRMKYNVDISEELEPIQAN